MIAVYVKKQFKSRCFKAISAVAATFIVAAASVLTLPASSFADAKLTFKAPSDVVMSEVTIDVYKGFPTTSSITESALNRLTKVAPAADGSYAITEKGNYSYYVRGTGYYSICKLFVVTADEVDKSAVKELTLATGKIAGNGFEPCNPNLANVPDDYQEILDARDKILGFWTDEILENFKPDGLVGYKAFTTPAFTKKKALHELSSQNDMMEFIKALDKDGDNMHVFTLGQTDNYKYDLPMVVFTTSAIPAGATLKEVGDILRENGKPTVWEQSQIHPNEPAAGEGALVMIQEMAGDYGKKMMEKLNVVIIPRVNPDGSYLFLRSTYKGFDMNRDHMSLKATELALIHTAYQYIMPELVIDDHEFTFYGASSSGSMSNAYDIESTPASSLNNSPAVNDFAMRIISTKLHEDLAATGLRNYHYGYTVNNPIGRAYYGLFNSISILVETRGIGAGRTNLERRVYSHVAAAKSMFETAALHAPEIRTMVATARQEIIDKGKKYDADDVLALYQTVSGNTKTPFALTQYKFNLDGTPTANQATVTLSMNDTIERGRVRPTAYILPKGEAWVDKALYILDNQGAEHYEIAPGSVVSADQYYYIGDYTNKAGRKAGFEAGLRGVKSVTFENGAIVVPMDQVAGNVIAMTMEPDVNDSTGYDGTLVQYGVVSADATTNNYPYYRFTIDDPREALPEYDPNPTPSDSGSSGGCNAMGAFAMLLLVTTPVVLVVRKKYR